MSLQGSLQERMELEVEVVTVGDWIGSLWLWLRWVRRALEESEEGCGSMQDFTETLKVVA